MSELQTETILGTEYIKLSDHNAIVSKYEDELAELTEIKTELSDDNSDYKKELKRHLHNAGCRAAQNKVVEVLLISVLGSIAVLIYHKYTGTYPMVLIKADDGGIFFDGFTRYFTMIGIGYSLIQYILLLLKVQVK